MRKCLVVLLLVTLLLGTLPFVVSAEEEITLRISWWGSQKRHDLTLKVIELFEKENPNIKIKPEYTGWGGYWDKMAAQAAGNNLADIMQQDYKYLHQYYQSGLLQPLDPFIKSGVLDVSAVDESVLSSGKVGGELYGISLGSNNYAVIYDPELLAKAGVPEPKIGWTWEDYMETARKIKSTLGIYAAEAMPMSTNNISGLEHYLRQHGYAFYDPSGKKLGYEDDQLFVDFYKMDLQLVKEGVLAPMDIRLEQHTVENDLIVSKKAAMAAYWTNQIVAISSAAGRPLKMTLFPDAKDQVRYGTYIKPSMFFSITKNSKHPEAAAKFIDFFTNSIEANKILMAERGVPISSKVREGLMSLLSPEQRMSFELVGLAGRYSSPIEPPPPPAHAEVIDILEDVHAKILYGVVTLEEGAKEFRERANAVLAGK